MMKYGYMFAVTALLLSSCADEPNLHEDEVTTVELTEQDKTFGITPEAFRKSMVKQANELGYGEFKWDNIELNESKKDDSFVLALSDTATMNGVVDKNGELKGITYALQQSDDIENDLMRLVLIGGITAKSLSPEVSEDEAMDNTVKLLNQTAEKFAETGEAESAVEMANMKYKSAMTAEGVWLSFTPSE